MANQYKNKIIYNGSTLIDLTSDTITAADLASGKTAHARGTVLTGTMPNNGEVTGTISTVAGEYTIPMGFHDGSGKVSISSTEQAKIIAANIRQGIEILGVTGTMSGEEGVNAQSKTVTPTASVQVITPDTNYNYLSQVTVNAIAYSEADNGAGGVTVTIGPAGPAS